LCSTPCTIFKRNKPAISPCPGQAGKGVGEDRPTPISVVCPADGEEIADRGDRVLGVVRVEHGHLARVDLQQQFPQVPGTEIGRSLDVEVVPHQVEQGPYLTDDRFGIGAQLPLRVCRPLLEAIQRRTEGVLRHRAQP